MNLGMALEMNPSGIVKLTREALPNQSASNQPGQSCVSGENQNEKYRR